MMLHRKKRRYILPYFLVIVIHLLFHSVYPLLGYDSSNVTLQGKTAGGTPVDVVADGNYAYVAASVFIAIYDISNPADPIQLSILPTDNNASDIKLSGNYLYVADSSGGLRIIDVTDKSNPVETGYYYESYETSPGFGVANVVLGVEVSGNYAYITEARNEGEEAGLKVIDITSKSSPIQAGHASTPEAYDLKLDDTYAYVVDYSSGLFVIDISAPASPSVAGYLSMDQGAKQIDISGNYAYIVNSGAGTDLRGLQVVDISNPFSPVAVSTWGISGLIYPDGVFISGTKAYIGYDTSGLYVIDISDPLNPAELGHYDSSGHARRAFVSDSTAYLADRESFLILNVSNPASITKLGEYITPSLGTSLAISGSYAYLGDSGKTALCVIDISQPAQPQLVEISDYAGTPNDLAISGNYICVAGGTADLRILNISNPLNVTQASLLSLAGEASGIDIYGNYACVAAKNGGVRIVDISNPLSPFEYNSFFTPFTTTSDIYDVRISSHYAYCVDYSSGLLVFDISDPANPDNVAVLSSAKKAKSIYIDGDYAYTCHDYYSGIEGSIQIFDISRPTSPVKTGYYNTGDYPNNVRVENGFAYVANGSYKGLTILDVSDPVNPLLAGYYSTPGSANDALPAGDKVYVADSGSGFWSFEFLQRYALSGYVKNSSGTAVPSMDVALSGKSSAGMKTDSNGFFEFTALSTGTYTVTVSSQNFTVLPLSRTLLVDKSSRDINFQADLNTYTITGTIETPSGDPLNGFAVALSR
ncbi:MAG TPA: carboxypeptidase regulatory-like domain-containing protein, partial [bacterium]|nr:carboxypeptidase regulatory-like domain-containing protein [bacterium]